MKTYALLAVSLLASSPLAVLAENDQQGAVALSAAQMDGVTAGMFQLPEPLRFDVRRGNGRDMSRAPVATDRVNFLRTPFDDVGNP